MCRGNNQSEFTIRKRQYLHIFSFVSIILCYHTRPERYINGRADLHADILHINLSIRRQIKHATLSGLERDINYTNKSPYNQAGLASIMRRYLSRQ